MLGIPQWSGTAGFLCFHRLVITGYSAYFSFKENDIGGLC